MRIGIIIESSWPVSKGVDFAIQAEENNYDGIWVNDFILTHDPFSILTLIASRTRSVRLGTATVNPYTRHPGILAASIASVDEVSGGRAVLGVGSSTQSMLSPLDIKMNRPVETCREAVQVIRQLLNIERNDITGSHFRLPGAKLTFKPSRKIPVFIGTSIGANMMRLAGEVADGAFLTEALPEYYRTAMNRIMRGRKHSENSGRDFEVVLNLAMNVGQNRKDAVESVRPLLASTLVRKSVALLEIMGLTEEKAKAYSSDQRSMPDELVQEFSLCGTVDDCLDRIKQLEKIGITEIAHRFPTMDSVRNVGKLLIPALKEAR